MTEPAAQATESDDKPTSLRTVITASSAGTTFEWYDFFVFGSLTGVISKTFFTGLPETAGFAAALALFGAGFLFQHVIAREARRMTVSGYRKNGLLVETLEGAESVRAAHAEWQLATRWNHLVDEVAHSDARIRNASAWSQNLVALLQSITNEV